MKVLIDGIWYEGLPPDNPGSPGVPGISGDALAEESFGEPHELSDNAIWVPQ